MTPDQILGGIILAALAVTILGCRAALRGLMFWTETEDQEDEQ